MKRFLVSALVLIAAGVGPAVAQQTTHPRYLGWEPPGFDFSPDGVWRVKARAVAQARAQLLARRNFGALNSPSRVSPSGAPTAVAETLFVPAVLFRYKNTDTTASFDTAQYSQVLFSQTPPGGRPYTVRTFYEQMSNNIFSMQGKVLGWETLDSNEVTYTGVAGTCSGNPYGNANCNGLFSLGAVYDMQKGLRQAIAKLGTGVNWGEFDNDGPDGIPNSGDDDGYVDMVMFVQPAKDGACGGSTNNHLWSHRYAFVDSLETVYQDVITATPWTGHAGQFIKIRNYFLQSGLGGSAACDSTQIMPVGTAAHESGHGLGLPDLYDTQGSSEGIGEWGLMGSGNYTSPFSPSRMEVWSLNELGWVTLVPLTTGGDYSVGPAPTADTAFYVHVNGSNPRGEYFLLENRERTLADSAVIRIHCQVSGLPASCDGGGLAIWHVDSEQIVNHGFSKDNTVNVGPIHGLALMQADGLDQLGSGANRGDAGDLYPKPDSSNRSFGIGTNPAAVKNSDGTFAGFVIDSIRKVSSNGPIAFRLRYGGLTSVRGNDTSALISVDAVNYHVFRGLFDSGSVHTVAVADTQYRVADSLVRWVFSSWSDGLGISHTVTGNFAGDSLTANLTKAFRVNATILAGGTATSSPVGVLTGAYFAPSTSVSITAHPTGGNIFLGWSGDTTASDSVLSLTLNQPYRVTANFSPPLQLSAVLQQLFTGSSTLSAQQISYLDANGNKNGGFSVDVGDFLAWARATHAVPAAPPAPGAPRIARLPLKGGRP